MQALALAGITALAAALAGCAPALDPAPLAWVADRAAGEVLALDAELCVRARVPLAAPRALVADAHGLWVSAASTLAAPDATRLVRLEGGAPPRPAGDFAALTALCADEGGAALVLERASASASRLWRIERDLGRTLLGVLPAARALAACPGRILAGGASGELVLLRSDGAVLRLAAWPEPVLALAPGPRAGEWWVLGAGPEPGLGLLAPDLAPRWRVRAESGPAGFAPVAGAERVWLAAGERVRRHGPGGVLELAFEFEGGPWTAAEAVRGGVLLRGVGAVVELGARGGRARVVRTQGGFGALVGLALSGPATAARPRAGSSRRGRA